MFHWTSEGNMVKMLHRSELGVQSPPTAQPIVTVIMSLWIGPSSPEAQDLIRDCLVALATQSTGVRNYVKDVIVDKLTEISLTAATDDPTILFNLEEIQSRGESHTFLQEISLIEVATAVAQKLFDIRTSPPEQGEELTASRRENQIVLDLKAETFEDGHMYEMESALIYNGFADIGPHSREDYAFIGA